MKKNMAKYIVLNLMAPGFGQFAMKKYIRGIIQIAAVTASIIWIVVVFGNEIKTLWDHAANGGEMAMHLKPFIAPIVSFILIWVLSFVDLLFFCTPPEPKPPPLPEGRGDQR